MTFGSGFVSGEASVFSHALAGEIDAIGVVNEAIEDGIGQRWVCDDFIPAILGHLTGDDPKAVRSGVGSCVQNPQNRRNDGASM